MCGASSATDSRARARCLMRQLIASDFSADNRPLHSTKGHTALLFGLNVNLSSPSARILIRLLAVHAGRTQQTEREAYIIHKISTEKNSEFQTCTMVLDAEPEQMPSRQSGGRMWKYNAKMNKGGGGSMWTGEGSTAAATFLYGKPVEMGRTLPGTKCSRACMLQCCSTWEPGASAGMPTYRDSCTIHRIVTPGLVPPGTFGTLQTGCKLHRSAHLKL